MVKSPGKKYGICPQAKQNKINLGILHGPLPVIDFFLNMPSLPENQESVLLAGQLLILVWGRGFLEGWSSSPTYETLCPRLPDIWGICPTAITGWNGCNIFSQLGNIGDFLSTVSSPAAFVVACTSGALAGIIAELWGLAFSAGLADVSSRGATPLKTSLSEKEEVAPHLLSQLLHTLC